MAGELDNEINQLQIVIDNRTAELARLEFLLDLAKEVNKGDVTPPLEQMLIDLYQYLIS